LIHGPGVNKATARELLNDCGLLPKINPVESAAVAEDCPLNFIPSAERFLWVNQLCLLKVIAVFICN
jgi:hypothetical protein